MLWLYWWEAIEPLRSGCSRTRTFLWFVVCVAGLTIRSDRMGVTSLVRALGLKAAFYDRLLDTFHSTGIDLDRMNALWAQLVLKLFRGLLLQFNGRLVLVGDGIKVSKEGRKMPAVKQLHQESESNTKPAFIMGHSFQAVSILSRAANSVVAVPLGARIHEGIVLSNRDRRTLLDRMINLLTLLCIKQPYYFVADAYYASHKIINGLLQADNHLVTRVKSNAVAYRQPVTQNTPRRGRPCRYGQKLKLNTLLSQVSDMEQVASPLYGERNILIRYAVHDLLWRPSGRVVRFVAVVHPTRGRCLLMSTDTALSGLDIIELYGLRFKIEHTFKQAVHVVGTFSYHFWMRAMTPIKRRGGNQYLHRKSVAYRQAIRRKLKAYHVFVLAGFVAQGLLHYLAACHTQKVWACFGSWLRTIRPGLAPSELVVTMALRNTFPDFLLVTGRDTILAKFITQRQDFDRASVLRLAS